MKKLLSLSQSGFTLMEIMVSGAMMVGIGMAGVNVFKEFNKQKSYLEKLRKLDAFHSQLSLAMQNVAHCNATFSEWATTATPRVPNPPGADIRYIYQCTHANCTDEVLATTILANPIYKTPYLSESSLGLTSQWIDPNVRDWKVRAIAFPNPLTNSGRGMVTILYELDARFYKPVRLVQKSFSVTLKFGGSPLRFVTCVSEKEANIRSAVHDLCETMGSAVTPNATFAQWDSLNQRCIPKAYVKNCNGWVTDQMEGLSSNAGVDCRSIFGGVKSTTFVDKTEVNCGANAPVLTAVGGMIKLVCP